ncbi:MAG: nucleotide modification associated domain-containing protein [Planctomycetia bacterium]|nr:nucleotide modification associated domain-containing protein [Planctomycetia bacterium]
MKELCDELAETLIAKNQNYGSSALEPPLLAPNMTIYDGLMTRLSDKVKRLSNLNKVGMDLVGESVKDTIKDIAGYCILTLELFKEVDDKKELPTMEPNVGDRMVVAEVNGRCITFMCVHNDIATAEFLLDKCSECCFADKLALCDSMNCDEGSRKDKKDVYFKVLDETDTADA